MPAKTKRKTNGSKDSTATIGFEAKLWLAADKLRNNMDAAEPSGARQTATGSPKGERGGENQYKHVVLGLIYRVHRELSDADLEKITSTYRAWRGAVGVPASARQTPAAGEQDGLKPELQPYSDIPGFCKSATTAEIAAHGHVLTPGRYVGAEELDDDGDPFEEKMPRLVAELAGQFAESDKLEAAIRKNLKGLSYAL